MRRTAPDALGCREVRRCGVGGARDARDARGARGARGDGAGRRAEGAGRRAQGGRSGKAHQSCGRNLAELLPRHLAVALRVCGLEGHLLGMLAQPPPRHPSQYRRELLTGHGAGAVGVGDAEAIPELLLECGQARRVRLASHVQRHVDSGGSGGLRRRRGPFLARLACWRHGGLLNLREDAPLALRGELCAQLPLPRAAHVQLGPSVVGVRRSTNLLNGDDHSLRLRLDAPLAVAIQDAVRRQDGHVDRRLARVVGARSVGRWLRGLRRRGGRRGRGRRRGCWGCGFGLGPRLDWRLEEEELGRRLGRRRREQSSGRGADDGACDLRPYPERRAPGPSPVRGGAWPVPAHAQQRRRRPLPPAHLRRRRRRGWRGGRSRRQRRITASCWRGRGRRRRGRSGPRRWLWRRRGLRPPAVMTHARRRPAKSSRGGGIGRAGRRRVIVFPVLHRVDEAAEAVQLAHEHRHARRLKRRLDRQRLPRLESTVDQRAPQRRRRRARRHARHGQNRLARHHCRCRCRRQAGGGGGRDLRTGGGRGGGGRRRWAGPRLE